MFYSKRTHETVTAAYERTIAILREQLAATQRQLDASLTREAEARRDHAQMAAAVAFPAPPRFPAGETRPPVRAPGRPRLNGATPWDELPLGDPNGSYSSVEEAALMSEDETEALKRALGMEPDASQHE